MEVAIAVIVTVFVGLLFAPRLVRRGEAKKVARLAARRALAASLGLGLEPDGEAIEGQRDGAMVDVRDISRGSTMLTRVRVAHPGVPRAWGLGAASAGIFSEVATSFPIGERAFDSAVAATGERAWMVAALSPEVRGRVARAVSEGWELADGAWVLMRGRLDADEIAAAVRTGLDLAAGLADLEAQAVAQLAARVGDDPSPTVRATAYWVLLRHYLHDAETVRLTERLLSSEVPALRLQAADVRRAHDVLAELALAADEAVALRALRIIAVGPYPAVVRRAFGELGQRAARGKLGDAHARAVAQTIAASAPGELVTSAEAEALFGALLELAGSVSDREAHVAALGRHGGIDAVPLLVPLRDRILGGRLGELAREAIAAIQARAGNHVAGGLQLVDEGGALAIATETEAQTE
ncbi:MAG: hypothetical protein U1F43_20855 [Myxococcota bacterium]